MSEEKNIQEEKSEEGNSPPAGRPGNPDSNRDENVNEHFPEDSHAPKQVRSLESGLGSQQQQAIENMEVHKHPHHVTHKKKWGEYLLEFLMLFLAIFLGFLAENQREHMVEQQREKKFIQSLASDLAADTLRLSNILQQRLSRTKMLDSFVVLMNKPDAARNSRYLYYDNSLATRGWAFRFTPVDGTMQQLKNAGNLRLIQKSVVSDSIIAYDVASRALVWGGEDEKEIMDTYRNVAEGIFDGRVLMAMRDDENNLFMPDYDPPLRITEDAVFRLNYRIHMLVAFNNTLRRDGRRLLHKATSLLALLKTEYHLK